MTATTTDVLTDRLAAMQTRALLAESRADAAEALARSEALAHARTREKWRRDVHLIGSLLHEVARLTGTTYAYQRQRWCPDPVHTVHGGPA